MDHVTVTCTIRQRLLVTKILCTMSSVSERSDIDSKNQSVESGKSDLTIKLTVSRN